MVAEVRGNFEEQRREIAMVAQTTAVASAWARKEAVTQGEQIIRDAQERAAMVVNNAEEVGQEQRDRVESLRTAIADLEASARNLATVTEQEVSVIDLSEIETIDTDEAVNPPVQRSDRLSLAQEPQELTELPVEPQAENDDDYSDEFDTEEDSDEADTVTPLLSVAEAAAEIEHQDETEDPPESEPEESVGERPQATTYYQRTTGTPLSERVKIARKSG